MTDNVATVNNQSPEKKFDITNPEAVSMVIAEFSALREEVLKLTEIQYQVSVLAIVAPGTIIAIGVQVKIASIMLLYPLFALFLGAIWLNHAHGIHHLGVYIRTQIESKVGKEYIGWETFSRSRPMTHHHFGFWGTRAIFVGTSILAIVAAIPSATGDWLTIVAFIIAISCTIANLIILVYWAEKRL